MLIRVGMALTCAAALIAVATPASAANGAADQPIRATGSGSGPIDLLGTGAFHTTGSFIESHLGKGSITVDSDPVVGFTAIETAANGDDLYITNEPSDPGGPLPTNCPTNVGLASGPYSGGEFISGGTGRFAKATGFISYSGCFSYVVDPNSPTGFTFAFTFVDVGRISY